VHDPELCRHRDGLDLVRAIHVPPRRINEIVLGKRTVSAGTAPTQAENEKRRLRASSLSFCFFS